MALTPAERARRYRDRQKSDPTLKERYLKKEQERKKASYVPVSNRSQRAQRKIRRSWRRSSKEYRDKRNNSKHLPDGSSENTQAPNDPNPPLQSVLTDKRKERGRKKVKKDRASAYRQLQKARQLLETQKRLTEKWKKRHVRVKDQLCDLKDSPRSKTKKLLKHYPQDSKVYKKLVFHHVLVDELRQKYRKSRLLRHKQKIRRIAAGRVIKKYRLMKHLSKVLGANTARLSKKDVKRNLKYEKAKRSDRLAEDIKQKVTNFFQQDDVSRQLPGKKDAITRKKIKKQKRLLNQHMTILHAKFLAENPGIQLHYSTFCKLRPWWVLVPKLSDLDTCMCKRCANMDIMNQKLAAEKVTTTVEEAMKSAVCDINRKECMYGECQACKGKRVAFQLPAQDKEVAYQQWVMKEKQYGDGNVTNITVKETFQISISSLSEKYEAELKPRYTTHYFNIFHQYSELRKLRSNLDENSVVLHVDFSENYSCKYSEEIQSIHFGASHQQASLHTGVYYTSEGFCTFCTISECTRHDPSAIWAHLNPILREIRERYPDKTNVHFISDGPTTQYRNKKNFWLASTIPKSLGFDKATWHFMEAGHGKGAPDGVGGVLKRLADGLVAKGKDIPNAHTLYDSLKDVTSVGLTEVSYEEVKEFDAKIPTDLIPVQGTMKIHQVLFTDEGKLQHRELSCVCEGMPCFITKQACLRQMAKEVRKERTSEEKELEKTEKGPRKEEAVDSTSENGKQDDRNSPKETSQEKMKENPTREKTSTPEDKEKDTNSEKANESIIGETSAASVRKHDLIKPLTPENARINDFVVVKYEGYSYPGVITDVDVDGVEVSCMSRVGVNRFFWPLKVDKIWYDYDKVITLIPPPEKVTNRHQQIAVNYWKVIEDLDLEE